MKSESQIQAILDNLFEGIAFPAEPAGLYDQLRYMLSIGGKRLRPKLCLTTYALFKDEFDDRILQPAAALEIFHSFTLIHDDIMDKSPLRRGVPTVWTKWGEDQAIISGDVMSIEAYRRMCYAPAGLLHKALELFTTTAAQICEGQHFGTLFESMPIVTMDRYMEMIGLKTAVLLACSAKLGAMIAGAEEAICENLYEYGYYLGLAFQVADDYLDAFGDEAVFGKPIGGDIVNNKKCWLTTHALEIATPGQRDAILEAMEMGIDTEEERGEKVACFRNIYSALGVDEDAKYEIIRLSNKALSYVSSSLRGIRLETMKRFADKLVGRTK